MIDLLLTRPKLKANLQFVLQQFGDEACCILEDPAREQFWRIGLGEWRLLNLLDGKASVGEAVKELAQLHPEDPMEDAEARMVVSWAIQEKLIDNLRPGQTPEPNRWMRAISASVFFRCRLGNPQPLLERVYPLLGFLTHPAFMIAWLVILLSSMLLLIGRWGEFWEASFSVVAPDQWIHFLLIWWGLKFVHELFHGLTCLRYGGTVREAGILFLLFAPLGAYVDVTSSWRFSSKWQRMHVTFAGIYIELLIAAFAAIGWSFSGDPLVQQLCLQTFLLASVATVLFNANPLIRFDGYYLLADLFEVPNLYQQGQLATHRLVSRIFMGHSPQFRPAPTAHPGFVLCYGLTSAVWRFVLCGGIAMGAAALMEGAGLLLAITLLVTWWVLPMLKMFWRLAKSLPTNPLGVLRAAAVTTLIGAAIYFSATRLRIPYYIAAPGIVRSTQSTVVRTEASGFLDRIRVRPGQRVQAGQILGTLSNPELDLEVLELEQELKRSQMRVQSLFADGLIAESQAENEVGRELQNQLENRQSEQKRLVVRAPHQGVVMDFRVDALNQRHFRRGDRLIEIADPDSLEFAFSVRQSENTRLDSISSANHPAELFMPGRPRIRCRSSTVAVDPQARWDLDSLALSATYGGPIAVSQVVSQNHSSETRTLQPRVHGRVAVPGNIRLTPGVVGTFRVTYPSRTIASIVGPWLDRQRAELIPRLLK
jgi:putative peptide zinc metalloprotease protein